MDLIILLVMIDARWVPQAPGCSLYIRPTMIGTRPCKPFPSFSVLTNSCNRVAALGVAASDEAMLYVILSPTGPYFRTGPKAIRLLAVGEHVRSWPGGTAGYKLGMNYPACFSPQQEAAKMGYQQVLWLFGDGNRDYLGMRVTEAGSMNFFVVVEREDGTGAHMEVIFHCGHLICASRSQCHHTSTGWYRPSWGDPRIVHHTPSIPLA